jgi:hypothetical protein
MRLDIIPFLALPKLLGRVFFKGRILNMNKKKSEEFTIYLLRSTYFNNRSSDVIYPEFYYISLPTKIINKSSTDRFYEFVSHVYDDNFSNEKSLEKMREDFARYYNEDIVD